MRREILRALNPPIISPRTDRVGGRQSVYSLPRDFRRNSRIAVPRVKRYRRAGNLVVESTSLFVARIIAGRGPVCLGAVEHTRWCFGVDLYAETGRSVTDVRAVVGDEGRETFRIAREPATAVRKRRPK